ncbi:hypothetical protein N9H39_02250 [Gammaproteobacteria bacterium]|nr:hypothetical protein [Gammaproteobacteria bacterium]
MTDIVEGRVLITGPEDLDRNLQALISSKLSRKNYADLDTLDKCVELVVGSAGWDALPQWRLCLHDNWSIGSVETAVTKAYFAPDLSSYENRYEELSAAEVVAASRLGYKGHFGNQLFQYAWLRKCAESHGLVPATRFWIGRVLFGFDDPVYSEGKKLHLINEFDIDVADNAGTIANLSGCDVYGYFQFKTSYWRPFKDEWRRLYTHTPQFQKLMDDTIHKLRKRGKRLVAIHVRQHEMMPIAEGSPYFRAGLASYLSWLSENASLLDGAVLYVAADTPDVVEQFADYNPISAKDLGFSMPVLSFLPDWWVCREADVLAIPNSTFSLTAAMLNEKATQFFRISPDTERLVPFDPWNTDVLLMKGGTSGWEYSRRKYLRKKAVEKPLHRRLLSTVRTLARDLL